MVHAIVVRILQLLVSRGHKDEPIVFQQLDSVVTCRLTLLPLRAAQANPTISMRGLDNEVSVDVRTAGDIGRLTKPFWYSLTQRLQAVVEFPIKCVRCAHLHPGLQEKSWWR